jgi:hypothetical protein
MDAFLPWMKKLLWCTLIGFWKAFVGLIRFSSMISGLIIPPSDVSAYTLIGLTLEG